MSKHYSIHFIVPLTAERVPKGKVGGGANWIQGFDHMTGTENTHNCLMTVSFPVLKVP